MNHRFLIIGAGPAGLYMARYLLRNFDNKICIDMIDRNLLPGGLLRKGVAPDNSKLKVSISHFDELFANPNFNFFGNVSISNNLSSSSFYQNYSAVVFANGAPINRKSKIENQDQFTSKIFEASELFGYYNGMSELEESKRQNLINAKRIVVIGNGNVTIDIVRLLTTDSKQLEDNLRINRDFVSLVHQSQLQEVLVLGRRGVIQSACTIAELRSLIEHSSFQIQTFKKDIEKSLTQLNLAECDDSINIYNRQNKKKLDIFKKLSAEKSLTGKTVTFRFLLSPFRIEQRSEKMILICNKMKLIDVNNQIKTELADQIFEEIECDLIVKSLGFEVENTTNFDRSKMNLNNFFKVGWAQSNGKGTIADLIIDCQNKSKELLEKARNGLIEENENVSFIESILKNKENPQIKSFLENRAPGIYLDKTGYSNFREFEKQKNAEIHDAEFWKTFCKKY